MILRVISLCQCRRNAAPGTPVTKPAGIELENRSWITKGGEAHEAGKSWDIRRRNGSLLRSPAESFFTSRSLLAAVNSVSEFGLKSNHRRHAPDRSSALRNVCRIRVSAPMRPSIWFCRLADQNKKTGWSRMGPAGCRLGSGRDYWALTR